MRECVRACGRVCVCVVVVSLYLVVFCCYCVVVVVVVVAVCVFVFCSCFVAVVVVLFVCLLVFGEMGSRYFGVFIDNQRKLSQNWFDQLTHKLIGNLLYIYFWLLLLL